MKRLHVIHMLLWLGLALGSANAAPPSYEELQNNPERALPMQTNWQLRAVDGPPKIWEDIFAFELAAPSNLISRSRWLGLNPGKNSELAPGLFDTLGGHVVSLSPQARSFCDGRWQTARVTEIGTHLALQPQLKVWLVERRPGGAVRTTVGYGRINAQGQWAVPPVSCDDKDTFDVDSADAISYLLPSDFQPPASDLQLDWIYAQPGLRDAKGNWRTPPPSPDIVTARWMDLRQKTVTPGSTASGLIDTRGNMVIPFIFGDDLPDVTPQRRIRLCTAAWQDARVLGGTALSCDWKQLPVSKTASVLRPAKAVDSGRWGYQDAQGRWVIEPQFSAARRFQNGYAVVSGLIPEDWRPPGWQEGRPVIRSLRQVGRYWVAQAMVRNKSTDGRWASRYAVLNDAGQWLGPVPQSPLHIAVLYPPGGRSSHYAELLAKHLPNLLGRKVQIDHVPTATEADYRRLMTEGGNNTVLLAAIRLPRGGIKGVHQDPAINEILHSLRPVTLLASQPQVLVIDSIKADALGIHSTDDLLAYAQANPGSLRIGTGEDGWTGQLAFGQFRTLSGVNVQRVIYKGMYPDSDVITKEHAVDLLFAPVNGVAVAVRRGQLRVIGTTADPAHPQIFEGKQWPTLASNSALNGFTAYDQYSLWAPADSDAESNRILQQAVAQVLAMPEVQKHLQELQVVSGGDSPENLLKLENTELKDWMRALLSTLR